MSAESERVGQRDLNLGLSGDVRHVIQITFGIGSRDVISISGGFVSDDFAVDFSTASALLFVAGVVSLLRRLSTLWNGCFWSMDRRVKFVRTTVLSSSQSQFGTGWRLSIPRWFTSSLVVLGKTHLLKASTEACVWSA